MASKHEAVIAWLEGCDALADIGVNFTTAESGAAVIVPADTLLMRYIDGSESRRYTVTLVVYLPVSWDNTDAANVDMQTLFEGIADWIDAQEEAGNYPDFPDGSTVESVEVLDSNAGYVAAQDANLGKYTLPFIIDYFKEA